MKSLTNDMKSSHLKIYGETERPTLVNVTVCKFIIITHYYRVKKQHILSLSYDKN
jgi:hypothetical protein